MLFILFKYFSAKEMDKDKKVKIVSDKITSTRLNCQLLPSKVVRVPEKVTADKNWRASLLSFLTSLSFIPLGSADSSELVDIIKLYRTNRESLLSHTANSKCLAWKPSMRMIEGNSKMLRSLKLLDQQPLYFDFVLIISMQSRVP